MNYNPYFNFVPNYIPYNIPSSPGLFSKIFKRNINWGNIINNTQKTLNIINQTIPVVKQVTPVVKNAKTMFKVFNEFKKNDKSENSSQTIIQNFETNNIQDNTNFKGPTFFA